MNALEALRGRRAVRNFEPREVEREKIDYLLEAAVLAPNDRLREPWHFYVVQGRAKRDYEDLARAYLEERFPTKPNLVQESLKVLLNTPLLIVVTADIVAGDLEASEDNEYAAACALHSMWLAAQDAGLGFVWRTRGVGLVRDERLYRFLNVPDTRKIVGTAFVGYPAGDSPPTARTPARDKTTWV